MSRIKSRNGNELSKLRRRMHNQIEVDYIDGIMTEKPFGVRVYQEEIHKRLPDVRRNIIWYRASDNIYIHLFQRLFVYPIKILFRTRRGRVTYITMPDLAYILHVFRFKKCIVGCYDLTSLRRIKDYHWITRAGIRSNYSAIRRYPIHIITHSQYSKNDIQKQLNISAENITVIEPAVDHDHYYPKRDKSILKKYGLNTNDTIALFVGSEEPRQNVDAIIKAIALVKNKIPNIKFLKIGNAHWEGAREKNIELVEKLGLQENVIFGGQADPVKELPKIYNASDLVLYPCDNAGWGLPPLESMACGVPAIVSNKTSLTEVAGDAALMLKNQKDEKEISTAIYKVLNDKNLRTDMIRKGIAHAKRYTWDNAAKKTLNVYKLMMKE